MDKQPPCRRARPVSRRLGWLPPPPQLATASAVEGRALRLPFVAAVGGALSGRAPRPVTPGEMNGQRPDQAQDCGLCASVSLSSHVLVHYARDCGAYSQPSRCASVKKSWPWPFSRFLPSDYHVEAFQ